MSARGALLAGVGVFVALVVGVAVTVLDSPAEERRQRLDARRLTDLQAIADGIDAHSGEEETLPRSLEALARWEGLEEPRTDPETGEPYRYRVTGEGAYELCATFATEGPSDERRRRRLRRRHGIPWHHPAGEHCFELEVDR